MLKSLTLNLLMVISFWKVKREIKSPRSIWWDIEPNVGRVAHGVSGRVHRLKGLGNSIVPKIAEEIGRAIIKAEKKGGHYE